jgi:arginase
MPFAPLVAPWASRFHGPGLEHGPDALAAALRRAARRVDVGPDDPLDDALARVRAAVDAEPATPLVLCGECTLAPAVAAAARARAGDVGLVWVDAHGDLNTPETSPSGFAGGMPFAALLGWCHDAWRQAAGLEPPFALARSVLVGARDLDAGEREAIDAHGLGERETIADGAALLADRPLWLHLDMDVLDPELTHAADFPAPGGWTAERFAGDLADAIDGRELVAVSVCCGNPRRDADGSGFRAIAAALAPLRV